MLYSFLISLKNACYTAIITSQIIEQEKYFDNNKVYYEFFNTVNFINDIRLWKR